MAAFAGQNKRTVLLLADLDGPVIGHLRSEAKRRYDIGFVVHKDTFNVKLSNLIMVGSLIRVAYFSKESLNFLNKLCVDHGPLTAYAFDYDYSGPKSDFSLTLPFIKYRKYTRNLETLLALFGEISHDIRDMVGKQNDEGQSAGANFRPLGHRIRNAALAIRSFNLNSTSHVVADLDEIADELLATGGPSDRKFDTRFEAKKALIAIGNLYDHVENSWMARIIVAGAVTAFITDVGWSAVFCQTVQLASWHGKDAFLSAVSKLPSLAGSGKAKAQKQIRVSIPIDSPN